MVHPIRSVVEQEELHVDEAECRRNAARCFRQTIARIAPKRLERFARPIGMHPTAVAVVGTEVMVIPNGIVGTLLEQPSHFRGLPCMAVPVEKSAVRLKVHLTEVNVVAQPQHHVWIVGGHAFENLISPTVRLSWSVVFGLIDECATAGHKGKRWRIHAIIPQDLSRHVEGFPCRFTVDQTLDFISRSRLQRFKCNVGCEGTAFLCDDG